MSQDNQACKKLDVREVTPRQRHELIFDTFHGLADQEAFELVNDHDPKPLYYQFAAEYTDRFSWEYLEQGPEIWRVRIGKTVAQDKPKMTHKPSSGCCG
ncbi:MAG TPA: DUF2249 domain-containing protein [Tepidisphaeraceae bacterium]|nr:DUF2249 domain-containing protein [Tepidisphaeraceae bacterium]